MLRFKLRYTPWGRHLYGIYSHLTIFLSKGLKWDLDNAQNTLDKQTDFLCTRERSIKTYCICRSVPNIQEIKWGYHAHYNAEKEQLNAFRRNLRAYKNANKSFHIIGTGEAGHGLLLWLYMVCLHISRASLHALKWLWGPFVWLVEV